MRGFFLLLLISGFPTWAGAATVQMEIAPKIGASAEYMPGQRDKPAVLVLHGFLQTRDFPTVATLARGLNDAGYTVLTPTLSLGIPLRQQSLPCEAIHRHRMDDDIREIARWVAWLKLRGHRSIVLIGHSFGSLQLLAYLNARPDKAVKAYVGASLIEAKIGPVNRPALIATLENRATSKQSALMTHSLSLCKNYMSTPVGLLSYVRWDQARTLAALRSLTVNTLLIMGDADTMVEHNWIKALKHIQVPMAVVPGANHFMDGQHEFDLLDKTLVFLGRLPKVAAK
ncbi:MAG: alpha/beta hydrolase [Thiobacillus sp.]|nr:alpha/beta hydrolase [Thiobacillus sp.]